MLMLSGAEKASMHLIRPFPNMSTDDATPSGAAAANNTTTDDDAGTSTSPSSVSAVQMTKPRDFVGILPCEVVRMIFGYLPSSADLIRCLNTCPSWYSLIVSDVLERVPLDPSVIHEIAWAKCQKLAVAGPFEQGCFEAIMELMSSRPALEALELRSITFYNHKNDFSLLTKAVQYQHPVLSVICFRHVDMAVDQLQAMLASCLSLTQVVLDSSYLYSSSNDKASANDGKQDTSRRALTLAMPMQRLQWKASAKDNPSTNSTKIIFPSLTYLELSGCTLSKLSAGLIVEDIIRCCVGLEHLVVEGCGSQVPLAQIFDEAMKASRRLKTFKAQLL